MLYELMNNDVLQHEREHEPLMGLLRNQSS